ncbi:MAG: GldM family protein [Bacteroidota bacterium]
MKKNYLFFAPRKNNPFILLAIITFSFLAFSKAYRQSPTVSVAADKMNILYIGVDNPITVAVEGVFSEDITVTCEDGKVENLGGGHFDIQVFQPGNKKITVIAKGITTREIIYRVKRVPEPRAVLGNSYSSGGKVSMEQILSTDGIKAYLSNWPREEFCSIESYQVIFQTGNNDPVSVFNDGAKFNDVVKELINNVKPGDVIYFDNVKSKCPGDPAARSMNSMVFKIG